MKKTPLKKLPRGEGSMSYVTRNGIEYICYKKVIGRDNYKKRHAVYGQTQQECIKSMKVAEKEYLKQISLLNPSDDDSMGCTLSNSMEAWLEKEKYGSVKDKTYDTLENTFRHIQESKLGDLQFSRVTAENINLFLQSKKDDGYSLSMMKKFYQLLQQYFVYVYAKDMVHNPMVEVKCIAKKDYEVHIVKDIDDDDDEAFLRNKTRINVHDSDIILNDEEMKKFVETATIDYKIGVHGWKYGYGLVFIMYSFVRIGEALALKWKDVNFENKTIHIYKSLARVKDRSSGKNKTKLVITTVKTESGKRTNILSDDAFNALQNHFNRQANGKSYEEMMNHYVFETASGKPASKTNLYRNVQEIGHKAQLQQSKLGIHKLRHTGISYYIRHGVPIDVVSKMAGHSSISITNEIYYSLVDKQFANAVEIMNNIK